jgi:dienelactone hydrolase
LLEGYVAWDDEATRPAPAVMVAHAWGGQGELEQAKARALAELGYIGFALDMYGKGVRGSSREENARLIQPFLDDRPLLMRRVGAALAAVKVLPEVDRERVAAIGFCFGGLCVLDLARSGADLAGVVSFHGLLNPPPESGQRIRARVLVLHGHDDPMVPVEQVVALERELTEAGADWQVHAYGNTVHAFTNPQANDPDFGTVYDARADRRSWQSMRAFLEEIFS